MPSCAAVPHLPGPGYVVPHLPGPGHVVLLRPGHGPRRAPWHGAAAIVL